MASTGRSDTAAAAPPRAQPRRCYRKSTAESVSVCSVRRSSSGPGRRQWRRHQPQKTSPRLTSRCSPPASRAQSHTTHTRSSPAAADAAAAGTAGRDAGTGRAGREGTAVNRRGSSRRRKTASLGSVSSVSPSCPSRASLGSWPADSGGTRDAASCQ